MTHNAKDESVNLSTEPDLSAWDHMENDNDDLLLLNDDLNLNTSLLRSDERYKGFDNNVGDTWIYPSNLPERAYQFNIVQKSLFNNTLVVLPTGLGKTFIAAVVMYNIYRWYPMGKVIFMAPTRPLVAQQIDACCKIVGIPSSDSVEITGKLSKASRAELWKSKRVFFATPQSVQSDILDTELNFPFQAVKLIVVDEAHRAKGRYSYTEVVRYILSKNRFFRILALSATPGRRKEDVAEVIQNLFISNIEVRTEESVDVVSYVHRRQLKEVVVQLGPKLSAIRDELLEIADPHIRNLIENRLISGRPGSISRNWLVMEHKKFREFTQNNRTPYQKEINSDFSICISVYHAIELLERHGLRVFLNNFDETQEGGPKFVVILKPALRHLIQRVREEIGPNPFAFSDQRMVNGQIAAIPSNIDFGHPKYEIARDHVLKHFENNKDSRVIIFCEYRESVMLMHRLLLQHRPLIRPRLFVGQGGTGSIRAVTQQQQIKVMTDFRSGESNALIATSVAEEGIDVGEVDLIVCFDMNTSNPTRFIQRIGRTGRKKQGKVLLLATEGKEHTMLKDVLSERNRMNKSISRGGHFTSIFYKQSPRMVPTEFNPKVLRTVIQIPEAQQPNPRNKPSKSKGVTKISKTGQNKDLRHFFKQTKQLDEEEQAIFENVQPVSIAQEIPHSRNTSLIDDSVDISHISLPTKTTEISNKMIKKMAKYVRNNTNAKPVDPLKVITSNKLSKDCLKFLLDFSPKLLLDVWSRMLELWNDGIDEHNIPIKGIPTEDRQVIRVYLQMLEIFGGKKNVSSILKNIKEKQNPLSYSSFIDKYKFVFGDMRTGGIRQDNFNILKEKFENLLNLFSSEECLTENCAQSMVYDDEVDETDQNTSVPDESICDYSNDRVLDSKYMSQWEEELRQKQNNDKPSPITNSSSANNVSTEKSDPKVTATTTADESDEDVIFVGETQKYSTPIRKGSLKQSLLNFNETPITSTVTKRHHKRILLPKRGKQTTLNVTKSTKSSAPFVKNSVDCPSTIENPEPQQKNHMSFFDDQFDEILAANSGIIEQMENNFSLKMIDFNTKKSPSLNCQQNTKIDHFSPQASVYLMPSKPVPTLRSDDSTPDEIISTPNISPLKSRTVASHGSMAPPTYSKIESTEVKNSSKQNALEEVHPELADIDFDNFSENFSDEISENLKTETTTPVHESLQRASPDIFDDLCEPISHLIKSPQKKVSAPTEQVSPCLLTKKAITWREVRQKYRKQYQPDPKLITEFQQNESTANVHPDQKPTCAIEKNDSVINVPSKIRPKRRIISSESESSEDENFSNKRIKKHVPANQELIRKSLIKKPHPFKRMRSNDFIDNEAVLSGSATEDENEHTIGCYQYDSVIVCEEEAENESSIPMTGVYLQSVRSPVGNLRGAFKIPERRQYNDTAKIFSQRVPEDNGSYMQDTFVVISDEEEVDGEKSLCPLERAEKILKMERRAKRKAKLADNSETNWQPARKKRILRIHNSSEDE